MNVTTFDSPRHARSSRRMAVAEAHDATALAPAAWPHAEPEPPARTSSEQLAPTVAPRSSSSFRAAPPVAVEEREGSRRSAFDSPPPLEEPPSWDAPASYPGEAPASSRRARPPAHHFGKLAARSRCMQALFATLERIAAADVTVTLMGETGVGKDVLAHALRDRSARAGGPMVVFDCGAVAANLAESELLGHERGAFTGAVAAHAGAFERAHGGTLFLDEVAELPLDLQPRLLRALESRKVRRVGGRLERPVDVRVIAATNRDLRAEVAAGRFREDLFFRLAVAVVRVPPLRERLEDMPEIVQSILADLSRPDLAVSEAAIAALRKRRWPGNVRELKNALSCAIAYVEPGEILGPEHLRLPACGEEDANALEALPLGGQPLERIERAAIRQTLSRVEGNKTAAARSLGIAVSTLYEKIKKYGL